MDHSEVAELIELAAVEPDGLDRLAAGDTPEAAAVAGHLAGCDECTELLDETARSTSVIRTAVRELPDPALRDRTPAFVGERGRDRSAAAVAVASETIEAGSAPDLEPVAATATASPVGVIVSRSRRRRLGWLAAGVAAVLIAGIAGFAAGGAGRTTPLPVEDGAIAMAAAKTAMDIAKEPDAVTVALVPVAGGASGGTVLYSAGSGELAMVAQGLAPTPEGGLYACWVERNGQKERIGLLYVDGQDGTWAGPITGLGQLPPNAKFGVSLVTPGSSGMPVLSGGR
jgi:hypothetical protein